MDEFALYIVEYAAKLRQCENCGRPRFARLRGERGMTGVIPGVRPHVRSRLREV